MSPAQPLQDVKPESPIRSIVMTECDFCRGPVAAPNYEELIKRMNEYGWKMTANQEVVCANCIQKWSSSV